MRKLLECGIRWWLEDSRICNTWLTPQDVDGGHVEASTRGQLSMAGWRRPTSPYNGQTTSLERWQPSSPKQTLLFWLTLPLLLSKLGNERERGGRKDCRLTCWTKRNIICGGCRLLVQSGTTVLTTSAPDLCYSSFSWMQESRLKDKRCSVRVEDVVNLRMSVNKALDVLIYNSKKRLIKSMHALQPRRHKSERDMLTKMFSQQYT